MSFARLRAAAESAALSYPSSLRTLAADAKKALRKPDLRLRYDLKHATLHKRINEGLWPHPVKRGRASFWPTHECEIVFGAMVAGKTDSEIRGIVRQLEAERSYALERAGWEIEK